jgi:hypothetical protein
MDTGHQLFLDVMQKLRNRFPSAPHDGRTGGTDMDRIRILQGNVENCSWTMLRSRYERRVADLYVREHGKAAGVPMVSAGLEIHCRALSAALDELTNP